MRLDDYETFKFVRRGRILTAIINRPDQMNAVNATMHREMASVFYDLQRDPDSDVIVFTGEGRAFCAGGDTEWFQRQLEWMLSWRGLSKVFRFNLPVLRGINKCRGTCL